MPLLKFKNIHMYIMRFYTYRRDNRNYNFIKVFSFQRYKMLLITVVKTNELT